LTYRVPGWRVGGRDPTSIVVWRPCSKPVVSTPRWLRSMLCRGRLETTETGDETVNFPLLHANVRLRESSRVLLGRWEPTQATRHYCVDSHKLHVRSGRPLRLEVERSRVSELGLCRRPTKVQGRHLSSLGRGYLFQDTTSHIRPAPKHVPPRRTERRDAMRRSAPI
jgi:hypothetical protein